ncbi:hypothetical protein ACFX13_022511 [Malus domestica]
MVSFEVVLEICTGAAIVLVLILISLWFISRCNSNNSSKAKTLHTTPLPSQMSPKRSKKSELTTYGTTHHSLTRNPSTTRAILTRLLTRTPPEPSPCFSSRTITTTARLGAVADREFTLRLERTTRFLTRRRVAAVGHHMAEERLGLGTRG